MMRVVSSCSAALVLALAMATPTWANASGNFHLSGGGATVACHWASFGGVGPSWATSGFIHCERYSDHTLVEMTRKGRIIVKKHYRGWVAPGGRVRHRHFAPVSRRITCVSVPMMGNAYLLSCSFFPAAGGQALRSFGIGPTGPVDVRHS